MKTGRNEPCPCGSGLKYKKCCESSSRQGVRHQGAAGTSSSKKGIGDLLRTALQYHQAGRLDQAEAFYRRIIETKPGHPDALHLLGLIAHQRGDYDTAERLIRKAVLNDPSAPFFHLNLGNTLKALGKSEEALKSYEKAVRLGPKLPEAHYNLANELFINGDVERALIHYKNAICLKPDLAEAHFNMGKALKHIDKRIDAITSLQRALYFKPDYPEAYYALGNILHSMKRYSEAVACYQNCLKARPDDAEATYSLGNTYQEMEEFAEAEAAYKHAVRIAPDFAEAYTALGTVLRKRGFTKEALEAFRRAVEIRPDFAEAHNNHSIALREDGQMQQAIESCERALAVRPDYAEAHWNLALALLSQGNLESGWRKYEWRALQQASGLRDFPYARWDGTPLREKTVLIYAEQGIGDQIMFASLIPEVMHMGGSCIAECDDRLVPLFKRSFPGLTVVPIIKDAKEAGLPHIDTAVPMGSLPLYFRPDLFSFSRRTSYLSADKGKKKAWLERLRSLGEGMKIGISWRGGKEESVRRLRSTTLSQWKDILVLEGVHFINLQYGDCAVELEELQKELGVTVHQFDEVNPLHDLDGFAALISALDLVISVDNSTVHMAGAFGVPAWVLLPKGCDWRWMKDYGDTPWYSSLRLFRQDAHHEWDKVFTDVRRFLDQSLNEKIFHNIKAQHSYLDKGAGIGISTDNIKRVVRSYSDRKYRCAIITPVGPGHEGLYEISHGSVMSAFEKCRGNFTEVIPIRIDDREGKLGRSKARNIGIKKAAEENIDWIFFLDADDLMAENAFEYVSPYLDHYDAIWGAIWSFCNNEDNVKTRSGQLPFLYDIHDVLSSDPFLTLQMGHFIKTTIAESEPFDETLDAGEDFDYYLRIWEQKQCIKIPLPFFYNRRGAHSEGERSATGFQWRIKVEEIILKYRERYSKQALTI